MPDIERWNVPTRDGNTLSVFYNRETNLLVVDVIDQNETGGCEVVRMTIDEPKALAHCRAADERDDTDQDNADDGGSYDRHDFDNDPDWR